MFQGTQGCVDSRKEGAEAEHECVLGRCKKDETGVKTKMKITNDVIQAKPTLTHMALAKLVQTEKVSNAQFSCCHCCKSFGAKFKLKC